MKLVSVSQAKLFEYGYTEITHQNEDGEVVIKDDTGHLEVFQIKDSCVGWSLPTEDGRCLEFVRAVVHGAGLSTHQWPQETE